MRTGLTKQLARPRQTDVACEALSASAAATNGVEREGAVQQCAGLAHAGLRDTWMQALLQPTLSSERGLCGSARVVRCGAHGTAQGRACERRGLGTATHEYEVTR